MTSFLGKVDTLIVIHVLCYMECSVIVHTIILFYSNNVDILLAC